ncbi:Ni/Fe hydrogenase subunit alpha [Limnochorda pilosa]|uniref:Nickel-dependent hydrogenase large subunit n=1 Tax=Limnochorda pilosa TaxID=1555112 RepID=A0A0K2SHW2_LIMPI|nr:nickel-dependent hydrogenase large subunit [Limnochorda pilosa]
MRERTLRVDYLARVEGEGALHLRLRKGEAVEARLEIFEPPRLFEGFLRGRACTEVPDLTARICGICPASYQMSSTQALEAALGLEVEPAVRDLRRLLHLGEWIESHALHVYLLHAPDFLGFDDAIRLARQAPDPVRRGLRLKKLGNAVMRSVGGREIHPLNPCVGGFYRAPEREDLVALLPELEWALEAARETVRWVAGFTFPELERPYEFVALRHPQEYPVNEGRVVSSEGLDIPVAEYEEHFEEEQVPHSTALRSRLRERGAYLVGPLARLNLNADRLSPPAREALEEAGVEVPIRNPFRSIVARSVELVEAVAGVMVLIERYRPPERPRLPVPEALPEAVVGHGCTEAPRGILYHRYRVGADGLVEEARIVPPTAQNQASIEEDLRSLAPALAGMDRAEATWLCEQAIRNYDPCMSCSAHFLTLTLEEG